MGVDVKNIVRVDMNDIMKTVRRMSHYAVKPYFEEQGKHPDTYAISDNELEQVFDFCMDGAAKLSDYASMVKHHTQTPIDALTNYTVYENPTKDTSYDETAKTITTPEGVEDEPIANIMGMNHASGQKLDQKVPDHVIFEVEDLTDEHIRYTVVQRHIRTALVYYVLSCWFKTVGLKDLERSFERDWEIAKYNARHNSAKNHARKNIVRKTRPSV